MIAIGLWRATAAVLVLALTTPGSVRAAYRVVDTGQGRCYNASTQITCPSSGAAFFGQDAQHTGNPPSYTLSADGLTVHDNTTGLTWQRSPDTNGNGVINASDKLSWTNAQKRPATLNAAHYGGYSDWRLPTIKELYSLIDFRGTDPSGLAGNDTAGLTPFIDTTYFDFAYGDTGAGERIIDAQYASSTLYVSTTFEQDLFGVNFADGRIKGYGLKLFGSDKTFFVQCVRGNTGYGVNGFTDNGDGTVTDSATGLMWTQSDSGTGLNWESALTWVQTRNAAKYLGYSDWRLPDAKELQSIVDYTRSPDTSGSAAIAPVFAATSITNEAGQADYPFYWTGTTHAASTGMGASGIYVAFGRAMGYMNGTWVDVHGAGAQRSDPKSGNPADYPQGHGPQGDAIRIYNYVRLVRDAGTDCGNNVVDAGEQCDDAGESAVCDANCTAARCGDSTANGTAGEQCDDGNTVSGDGCDAVCRLECNPVAKAKLTIRNLHTPPGDDKLTFTGQLTLPSAASPALNPLANGVRLLIDDNTGSVLDVPIAPGAFAKSSGKGWTVNRSATRWTYLDKTPIPAGGIYKVVIQDKSKATPGLVQFTANGKAGSYAVSLSDLPVTGRLVLDPPAGQCMAATSSCSFNRSGSTLTCK